MPRITQSKRQEETRGFSSKPSRKHQRQAQRKIDRAFNAAVGEMLDQIRSCPSHIRTISIAYPSSIPAHIAGMVIEAAMDKADRLGLKYPLIMAYSEDGEVA